MGKFLEERGWKQDIISKEYIVSDKVALLRGVEGVSPVKYLTSVDQPVPY